MSTDQIIIGIVVPVILALIGWRLYKRYSTRQAITIHKSPLSTSQQVEKAGIAIGRLDVKVEKKEEPEKEEYLREAYPCTECDAYDTEACNECECSDCKKSPNECEDCKYYPLEE